MIILKIQFGVIKIFFGEILHLRFNKDKLLGFQSWKYDEKYVIEYTFEQNTITSEYDDIEKWKFLLKLLDENL